MFDLDSNAIINFWRCNKRTNSLLPILQLSLEMVKDQQVCKGRGWGNWKTQEQLVLKRGDGKEGEDDELPSIPAYQGHNTNATDPCKPITASNQQWGEKPRS